MIAFDNNRIVTESLPDFSNLIINDNNGDIRTNIYSFFNAKELKDTSIVSRENQNLAEKIFKERIQNILPNIDFNKFQDELCYAKNYNTINLQSYKELYFALTNTLNAISTNKENKLSKEPYHGMYSLHIIASLWFGDELALGERSSINLEDYSKQVNIKDCYGTTPLFYALLCGNSKIAKWLIKKGASLDETIEKNYQLTLHLHISARLKLKFYQGETALHVACRSSSAACILLTMGKLQKLASESLNKKIETTKLMINFKLRNTEFIFNIMKYLIETNDFITFSKMLEISWLKEISHRYNSGSSLVHHAIFNDKPNFLELLLDHGANADAVCSNNLSALKAAIYKRSLGCIFLLIKYDADLVFPTEADFIEFLQDEFKHLASGCRKMSYYVNNNTLSLEEREQQLRRNYQDIICKIKTQYNLDVNKITYEDRVPGYQTLGKKNRNIFAACEYGNEQLLKDILDKDGDYPVDIRNNQNCTPLMAVAARGHRYGRAISMLNLAEKFPHDYEKNLKVLIENNVVNVNKFHYLLKSNTTGNEYFLNHKSDKNIINELNIPQDFLSELKVTKSEFIIKLLKSAGADFNLQSQHGGTALHVAVRHFNFLALPALFRYGCNPDIGDFFIHCFKNHESDTALRCLEIYNEEMQKDRLAILHTLIALFSTNNREKFIKTMIDEIIKKYGKDILYYRFDNASHIEYAIRLGNSMMARYFINQVDVNNPEEEEQEESEFQYFQSRFRGLK